MINNLKAIREKAGVKAKDLAPALGITASTYSMYENGNREPKLEFYERLSRYYFTHCDGLDVTLDDFFTIED